MTALTWDQVGERVFETGVDHGVLYIPDNDGNYNDAFAWNGLTSVNESPSGAEANPQFADNIKYVNLVSAEEFAATIEALTYPDEFEQCDGSYSPSPGVHIGQQGRKTFGFCYRTQLGNDVQGTDYGYKLHLVYGALAAPSEKNYATINDSPEAITFSWEVSSTPVPVTGHKPTASITIDSTKEDPANMEALQDILYGTGATDGRLPMPDEVIAIFAGTITEVETQAPTYNSTTDIVTIPAVTGVQYRVDGVDVPSGAYGPITDDVVVTAVPMPGYSFTENSDDDWVINFA